MQLPKPTSQRMGARIIAIIGFWRRPTAGSVRWESKNRNPFRDIRPTRFGTWMKALAAFMERVNAEPDSALSPSREVSPREGPFELMNRTRDERRDVPLGLRFRVLSRDRFKCVLCGAHPARNPDFDLQVDHVTPWSRAERQSSEICGRCVRNVMSAAATDTTLTISLRRG